MTECPVCHRDPASFMVQPHDPAACLKAHADRPAPQVAAYAQAVEPPGLCRTCGMIHAPGRCP